MWRRLRFSPSNRRAYLELVPLRRRVMSIGLTIAAHLLLLLLLFRLAPPWQPREPKRPPSTFSMLPDDSQASPRPAPKAKAAAKADRASASAAKPPPVPLPVLPKTPTTPVPPGEAPPTILWDKALYAAADVGKMKGKASEVDGDATGKDSAAAYGPGEGPGGARLYDAQWYRKPAWSEVSPYLPADPPTHGQAVLACRMVEHYHVDNCQVISESPRGSGMGRAIRLAAWQFLVRPPRLGGKVLVGEWVKITYDLSIVRQ